MTCGGGLDDGHAAPAPSSHRPVALADDSPVNRPTRAATGPAPPASRSRTVTPSPGSGWAPGASGLPCGLSAESSAPGGSTLASRVLAGSGPACRPVATVSRSWL